MQRRDFITLLGGAAIVWPLTTHAQQAGKTYKIGWLSAGSFERSPGYVAFFDALRELGWIEGEKFCPRDPHRGHWLDRLPELAAQMVCLNVDVIVAVGTLAPLAARQATTKIPIVMTAAGDPLGTGLVTSLARPGGNVTGNELHVPTLVASGSNCSRSSSPSSSLAWPFFGTRPILTPQSSSKRRRPRAGHWG